MWGFTGACHLLDFHIDSTLALLTMAAHNSTRTHCVPPPSHVCGRLGTVDRFPSNIYDNTNPDGEARIARTPIASTIIFTTGAIIKCRYGD